jgi:hypothetical protein
VTTGGTAGSKLREWIRRYLPCEIAGTVGELGGAAIAYLATGSLAAAAITATIGASAGYYAIAYVSALRCTYGQRDGNWAARVVVANLLALRSVAIEFGPAELIDSIAVRPVAFYLGPLMFDHVIAGWIFGKLVSDVAFYLCAIVSYERFKGLLAQRQPHAEEVGDEPGATVAAAALSGCPVGRRSGEPIIAG